MKWEKKGEKKERKVDFLLNSIKTFFPPPYYGNSSKLWLPYTATAFHVLRIQSSYLI
jgi:hypothetical protein